MAGYLYRGEAWDAPRRRNQGQLRKVDTATFCEMKACTDLAAWRIGYADQSVSFCPRHTLQTMRNRGLWGAKR